MQYIAFIEQFQKGVQRHIQLQSVSHVWCSDSHHCLKISLNPKNS